MTNPISKRNQNGQSIPGREEQMHSPRERAAADLEGTVNPNPWDRRSFLTGFGALAAGLWIAPSADALALPEDKIKVVRYFSNSGDAQGRQGQPMVNQSNQRRDDRDGTGLIGIGEGGEPRTMDECASMLIGLDPFRIDNLWQRMMRGYFYPAGREKTAFPGRAGPGAVGPQGQGAGRAGVAVAGRQVAQLRRAATPRPFRGRAAARWRMRRAPVVDAGFRTYRYATDNPREREVDRFKLVQQMYRGLHRCCTRARATADGRSTSTPNSIRPTRSTWPRCWSRLHPYFCEDLIRSENVLSYETIRQRTRVPIAVGEQFGYKWDVNTLIEKQLIDYARVTLPNVGGISEFMKIIALAETHYVGMIPHFTGPIAEAALVHCLTATSIIGLMEMLGNGTRTWPYLPRRLRLQGRQAVAQRPARAGRRGRCEQADEDRRVQHLSRRHVAEPTARWFVHELVGCCAATGRLGPRRLA